MKIIFFGATKLGYKCLNHILSNKLCEVECIITIPEKFDISYSDKPVTNVLYVNFKKLAREYNIPIIEINKNLLKYYEFIKNYKPDFILAIGWYYIIPEKIRMLARLGCAGIHASLLPKYRGGAPLVWALINGEKKTGVSFFYFDNGVDKGDIIAQKEIIIKDTDTISVLLKKVEKASLSLIDSNLQKIAKGQVIRIKQNESFATFYPQRKPEDGLINWNAKSSEIYNFIRAQTKPYPGAFTVIKGKKVIIWDANIIDL